MSQLDDAAAKVLGDIAAQNGVEIDAAALVQLASTWVGQGIDLVSAKAKEAALKAGNDAAEKVTTLEEAEQSAKKR